MGHRILGGLGSVVVVLDIYDAYTKVSACSRRMMISLIDILRGTLALFGRLELDAG